jgi:CRISPR-associated protein Cas1
MFLNLNSHHIQQEIFKNQIEASVPLKKQLWQQTIIEKITNQGILLEKITGNKNSFDFLASKVLSGDTSNMEGCCCKSILETVLKTYDFNFKRERLVITLTIF